MKTESTQMVIFHNRSHYLKIMVCFCCPAQVLSYHIPFLVSSIEDFKDHIPRETDMKVIKLYIWIFTVSKMKYVLHMK